MNDFNLRKINEKKYILCKNNLYYLTEKKKKIFFEDIVLARKVINELNKKNKNINSNFLRFLFFSYDLDKEIKPIIISKILNYINTDLICYRAKIGTDLEIKQRKIWNPLLRFCNTKFSLNFVVNNTVMPNYANKNNFDKVLKIIKKMDRFNITTFFFLVETTGSIILSLNVLYKNISVSDAWKASILEIHYNQCKWGKDRELQKSLNIKKKFFTDIMYYTKILD